jgi:hypothetical protein
MDIKCKQCNASLIKSYGTVTKLRSRHVRWDNLDDTATVQCNMCRSWSDIPLSLRIQGDNLMLEVGTEIKKSGEKEKLIITEIASKHEK